MSLWGFRDIAPHLSSARRNISGYLLGIVVAALVPMALITLGLVGWTVWSQRQDAEAEMSRTVRAITVALDQQLLVTTAALESLAATMQEGGAGEHLYRIAQAVKARHPYWSHVTLRDAAGAVVFTTAVPHGVPIPKTADLTAEIAETIGSGLPKVSDLLYGPIADVHAAAVLVPVRAKDGQDFVLIAAVATSKWEDLLRQQQIPPGWVAGIIDRRGVVVARTRAAEQSVGQPAPPWVQEAIRTAPGGHATGAALEGEPLSLVFARSAVAGWTVAFAAPASVFETPLRRSLWVTTTISLLVLGGASLLVLRYARRLSRSVAGLAQVADALQTPGAPMPPPPRTEVAELASVYASMLDASVNLHRAEEQRVTSMRELQHRVKNDLQAILSLISLESSLTKSDDTLRILAELQGRIEALRLVHSRLYENRQVGTVELGGYLRELSKSSVALYGHGKAGGIALRVSVEEVSVDHDTAVSLGLIANEFITNSAKHAFPHGSGTITLELSVPGPGQIRLRLADDGIGLPPGRTRSSGLQLIAMLAEQVGATPEWTTNPGTALQLSLEAGTPKEAA